MIPEPAKRYDVIYMDPPWSYYGDPNKMGAAGKEYNLMEDQELAELTPPLGNPETVQVLFRCLC